METWDSVRAWVRTKPPRAPDESGIRFQLFVSYFKGNDFAFVQTTAERIVWNDNFNNDAVLALYSHADGRTGFVLGGDPFPSAYVVEPGGLQTRREVIIPADILREFNR